jgi:uncharacterized protein YbjT (DUF2867 family)
VDIAAGIGLAEAVAGAEVVVDVANAAVREDDAVVEFFTTSTRNLLAAERDAGVAHHLALTIVGAEHQPDNAYFRAKVAQEELIQAGSIPYTILRATQFFEFVGTLADFGADGTTVTLAPVRIQPVAADDVADVLAALAETAPGDCIVEVGGPEQLTLDDLARRLLAATGDPRTVVTDPAGGYFRAPLGDADALVPGPGARIGAVRFGVWLDRPL